MQTVDFFTPIVDDPFDFGRIAATNALSDVYAMGGNADHRAQHRRLSDRHARREHPAPHPRGRRGGGAARPAWSILGGHTVKDEEPKYGMAVTGTIHPDRIVTNAGARPGDHAAAHQADRRRHPHDGAAPRRHSRMPISRPAIAEMTRLNAAARDAMLAHDAHAATDITGFGLLGHAVEMARASHVGIEIESAAVPLFPRVLELIDLDFVPSGTEGNLMHHGEFTSYADHVDGRDARRALRCDDVGRFADRRGSRTTSARCTRQLAPTHTCAIVGRVTEDGDGTISVL